jgi:hypothetical protein
MLLMTVPPPFVMTHHRHHSLDYHHTNFAVVAHCPVRPLQPDGVSRHICFTISTCWLARVIAV